MKALRARSESQESPPTPYGSALDLPSVAELLRNVEGMKLLTTFVARDHHGKMKDLAAQLRRVGEVVDLFYGLLGARNWVFHEDLDVSFAENLVSLDADGAERALIEHYKDPASLGPKVRRLSRFPELRARRQLRELAATDFHLGRYSACVKLLLSVMDGFVNDLDPDERRGLHARESDELHAWDSVVGHHLGLAHAHESFTRTFKKRVDEPTYELHRHGIVHGMITNYDKDVVAAKAWNRLFAVADWATSREKRSQPAKPRASWRETLATIARNTETRKALDEWRPSRLSADEPDFDLDALVVMTRRYLDAWTQRNYGSMAGLLSPIVSESSHGRTAGQVREAFEDQTLTQYRLESVDRTAAAVARVDVVLEVDNDPSHGGLRWVRLGDDTRPVAPNEAGSWGLVSWTLQAMRSERQREGLS